MRALRLNSWKSEPVLEEVDMPTPGPGQVVIRVGGAGACHSDLHLMHEFEDGIFPWTPPFTLGHETAGWVDSVGSGVTGLSEGQAVAVYGWWGCGRCSRCRVGIETMCENPAEAIVPGGGSGLGADGGMAEYMLVPDERLLLPLPDGLTPVEGAPLTDAGLTPYHAVARSRAKLTPEAFAVVIGAGGLGHLAVQILKATTAVRVVAVDIRPEALQLATSVGADFVVPFGDAAATEIRDLTAGRGANVVIDCVGSDATLALGAAVVRSFGDLTIAGVGGGSFPVSFFSIPYEVSVQTINWGSRPELADVLELGARGLLTPAITTYALEDAPRAYEELRAGRVEGRAVIVP
jgi:alcohol dehydrogenase, propanol-preferring